LVGEDFAGRDQEAAPEWASRYSICRGRRVSFTSTVMARPPAREERGGRVAATLQEDRDGIVGRDAGRQ